MAKNDRTTAGPYWTRNWIEKMWRFTAENFVDFDTGAVDFEALGREEYEFRKALFYRKFKNSERAREAFVESEEGYKTNVENGKKGGRPRKETTADASEGDGEVNPDGQQATQAEAGTSANTNIAKPTKNAYGEFGNVKMTTAEFEKFVQVVGADRANALIEELSSYLASSGKRYKSHYATLLNWCRRKDKEGEPKQKFLTADDISRRNIEESKRQLDALMANRRAAHG